MFVLEPLQSKFQASKYISGQMRGEQKMEKCEGGL